MVKHFLKFLYQDAHPKNFEVKEAHGEAVFEGNKRRSTKSSKLGNTNLTCLLI